MLVNTKSQKHSNQRYLNALNFMKESGEFHTGDVVKRYYITNYFPTVCAELEFIVRTQSNRAKWVLDREPNMRDVITIKKEIRKRNERYGKSLSKAVNEFKIQPIKRVERTQPVRVQEEPIHDTSNSKVILILAVGAMVGFLIATIIWK